jgi:hypothetical protein
MKIDFKENTQLNLELQRHAYLSKKELTLKLDWTQNLTK